MSDRFIPQAVRSLTLLTLSVAASAGPAAIPRAAGQTVAAAQAGPSAPGAVIAPDKLAGMLPPSVYFQGRSAPLQVRNAGGASLGGGAIVWAALVDASGYATSIQERYQFYLVSEGPLKIGDAQLPAGAYGGGFLGDHFLLMDLGGHTVAQGPLHNDAALPRPRPLQMVPGTLSSVKLYLGRRWISLEAGTSYAPQRGTD